VNFTTDAMNMEREAFDEEKMDKERKKRMGGVDKLKLSREGGRGTASAPSETVREAHEEEEGQEELFDEEKGEDGGLKRDGRASKSSNIEKRGDIG
jgi:hypothetical protein